MPENLFYETADSKTINEIIFSKTIKSIPSKTTSVFIRSESETLLFRGTVRVNPSDGRSFSEDLSISDAGELWHRSLEIVIPPLERVEIKMKVVPISTPTDSSGKASITVTGTWENV